MTNKRVRRSGVWLLLSLLLILQPALNAFAQTAHLDQSSQVSMTQMSCSDDDHGCHQAAMDQQLADCCDQASASDCTDHCSASSLAMLAPHHANIALPALQPLQVRGSPASPFVTLPEQPPRFV